MRLYCWLYIDNSIDQSGHGWYVREKKQNEHVLNTNHLVSANQSGRRCSSPTVDAGKAGGFQGLVFHGRLKKKRKSPNHPQIHRSALTELKLFRV